MSCCPVQKQNNWVGCHCPFQGLQSKTHSPFQGTCCPCQGFSFFGFGLCLLATCHHLHPGSAITFSFFFTVALLYWLWQRPGSLLATSFALAFSCFCFGPSSFHWCRPCWLLRALGGLLLFTAAAAGGAGLLLFGVGLLLFGTCQVKKNDVGIFVQSRPHFFFVTKIGFKKWQKTSSAEVLTPPHLGLLAVGPSSPAGLARQPNLACKTDPVVLDQNGQWCWIKMGLWSQEHHQWIFGCNHQKPEAKQMGIDENMKPKGTECCQKNTCLPEKMKSSLGG